MFFSALNVSSNFAIIDYDTQINTKIITLLTMFFVLIVQELNTLRTVCELERDHLLTILSMSEQLSQFIGFF